MFQNVLQNSLEFVFNLTNTSDTASNPAILNENRVTAFGFSLDGTTVDIIDVNADEVWSATTDISGNSFSDVDVCVYQGSTCTGGANTGLFVGTNTVIGDTLSGTFGPPLEFAEFSARFQSTGPDQEGSLKLTGTVTDGTPLTDVPEPASLFPPLLCVRIPVSRQQLFVQSWRAVPLSPATDDRRCPAAEMTIKSFPQSQEENNVRHAGSFRQAAAVRPFQFHTQPGEPRSRAAGSRRRQQSTCRHAR